MSLSVESVYLLPTKHFGTAVITIIPATYKRTHMKFYKNPLKAAGFMFVQYKN